jgi:hypothetical protein
MPASYFEVTFFLHAEQAHFPKDLPLSHHDTKRKIPSEEIDRGRYKTNAPFGTAHPNAIAAWDSRGGGGRRFRHEMKRIDDRPLAQILILRINRTSYFKQFELQTLPGACCFKVTFFVMLRKPTPHKLYHHIKTL